MKKYLTLALAMPLLFACSNDLDVIEKGNVNNDSFAGIEKVDATFTMADNRPTTRMQKDWDLENGDMYGFAWLGDGTKIDPSASGEAYQNHPLTQTDGHFVPQTSIYVGKYYLYRPYDYTTVDIQAINFNSLVEQPLTDGQTGEPWKALAKNAIVISDKWTNVTTTGSLDAFGKPWDKAGIGYDFNIYAAFFSNQTGLDLAYVKNNPKFGADKVIAGASDIAFTIKKDTEAGSAGIYEATVQLDGAAKSFAYAPKAEPNASTHDGGYWADKSGAAGMKVQETDGFTFTPGAITLTAEDQKNGVLTGDNGNTGWFWFNSLPKTAGDAAETTTVNTVLTTSYGTVTVNKTLVECAYELEVDASNNKIWHPLAAANDNTTNPTTLGIGANNTFVNQYGNHKGKYALTVDFSKGVMNGMCIKNDAHLQKLLKYYIAAGKTETNVKLNLDADEDGEFKLSKLSIALLQTINDATHNIKLQKCATHGATLNIVITQNGQDGDLAAKQEVPTLNDVFETAYDVYLAANTDWTLSKDYSSAKLNVGNVTKITNLGTLNVTSPVVNTTSNCDFVNANEMNVTAKVDFAQNLENTKQINIASGAWLRAAADGKTITNQAGTAHGKAWGMIDNKGEFSVKAATTGAINNYGYIKNNAGALTLITKNEIEGTKFNKAFSATSNAFGEIEMEVATDYVSVKNSDAEGFITYVWDDAAYETPDASYKFNYLKIANNIEFGASVADTKIKFLEFNGSSLQTVKAKDTNLTALRGIYVPASSSFVLDIENSLKATEGVYVAGEIKVGGTLNANGPLNSLYFGTTSNLGNISVWGTGTLN